MEFIATDEWQMEDWQVSFHKVNHGENGYSYGIRFQGKKEAGTWAYMPDAFQLESQQFAPFRQLHLLIMGSAYWHEKTDPSRRSIYDVQEALALKEELGVENLVLTHLSHDIDVTMRRHELPAHTQFAFDGMQLSLPI
jgi:phosphoribosyl 1,2-cyclic phosphate phosphodiesterase